MLLLLIGHFRPIRDTIILTVAAEVREMTPPHILSELNTVNSAFNTDLTSDSVLEHEVWVVDAPFRLLDKHVGQMMSQL